jgi:LDH2 family malate/lactate/ureidoglycolate dehydrogenase
LSPEHFAAPGFAATATEFADYVRSAAPADPDKPVKVPGDIEREKADEQLANGVNLASGTWHDLAAAAAAVDATVPEI